jgi:peptidoglycan/LPS O-acetylase OafA/YrhL
MKESRLLGIELIRILASYAVVLVHSGDETWNLPIDAAAIQFRLFFYFGVPFFLITSFYFLTAQKKQVYCLGFWKVKVQRLLVPYAIWSGIFLIARAVIFTATDRSPRLQQLISDPLQLILFGGASYQLYFLPMLFVGTLLILTKPLMTKFQVNTASTIFLATLAVICYSLLENSGNGFHLGETDLAFEGASRVLNIDLQQAPLLRSILVGIAWMIRCLPYFLISVGFHQLRVAEKLGDAQPKLVLTLAILVLAVNTLGQMFLPAGLAELALACTLLLLSISISRYFIDDRLASFVVDAGKCSFGIYLIHPFVMYMTKPLIGKLIPIAANSISIYSILLLSLSCFLMSWAIVAGMVRHKSIGRYLFGV